MADPTLGAATLIGGQALGAINQAGAARRQNRILADGIRQQGRAGMEAASVQGDLISQLRASRPNPGAEQGMFRATVGGPAIGGPGGARFRADAAQATGAARGTGNELAALFARMRAPQLQRQQESELRMNAGNLLRPIQMRSQDAQFLTNLNAGMQRPDPWMQLLGQGLTDAGSYMVSRG